VRGRGVIVVHLLGADQVDELGVLLGRKRPYGADVLDRADRRVVRRNPERAKRLALVGLEPGEKRGRLVEVKRARQADVRTDEDGRVAEQRGREQAGCAPGAAPAQQHSAADDQRRQRQTLGQELD
jgi:hypothetical protein